MTSKFHTLKIGDMTHVGEGSVDQSVGRYDYPDKTFCGINAGDCGLAFTKPQSLRQLSKRQRICDRCQNEALWIMIDRIAGRV